MAHFLFCPVPQPGAVFPAVPVAHELVARGHQVAFLIDEKLAPVLAEQKLRFYVAPDGVYGSLATTAGQGVALYRYLLAPLAEQLRVLAEVAAAFVPDVLVDGVLPLAPRLFAERHGLLQASIHTGIFPIPTRDLFFPFGAARPPPRTPAERTMARLLNLLTEESELEEVAAWDAARTSLGLPASGEHPCTAASSRHLVLMPTAPALEYRRTDLPPHFWFVGPLVWQKPSADLPDHLRDLGDPDGPPAVFVTQGTVWDRDPRIVRLALRALAEEPVRVVATLVRPHHPGEVGRIPDNAVLEPYIEFSRIVDRLALVINHAGSGTIHASLSHGVPLVLLPLQVDQPELAARCAHAGVAIRLDVDTCTPEALRDAVRTILGGEAYRARARAMRDAYAALGGPSLAASLLERLATSGQPVCRPPGDDPWRTEAPGAREVPPTPD